LTYTVEKALREHGDKLPATEKEQLEKDIASVKELMEKDDLEALKSAVERLTQSSMKIGEIVYKAEQEAPASNSNNAESGDGKVVDGEYENIDDENK
jgi:molecular chaperone DnaK